MQNIPTITTETLRQMLSSGQPVNIIDIRPLNERAEWFIPGSIHIDVYNKLKHKDATVFDEVHLDKSIPAVTVCGGGKTSLVAAGILGQKGYNAFSLQEGMKGWSLSWNTAKLSFPDFQIIQFRRTGKGCLSYIVASNNDAIVVDASLPVETYQQVLAKEKMNLKYVIETHIHADHLSRSKQLAENNNVSLYLPVPNKVSFDFTRVNDNSIIQIGKISMRAIHAPGHTPESTCYLIDDKVLLTGDTLFIDGVGRPDLKANDDELMERSKMLYQSLQKLFMLNDNIIVLPAHTSRPVAFDRTAIQATIGSIKQNVAMLKLNEEEFGDTILRRIPPTPPNYLSIVEKNIKGDFSDVNPVDLEAGPNRCAVS